MTEVERVEAFVKNEGLDMRTRKHELVDRRTYLAVYLLGQKLSLTKIAKMLGCVSTKTGIPDHATIKYYIENRFPEMHKQRWFINNVLDLMQEFPLSDINVESGLYRSRLILCELSPNQYSRLQLIRLQNGYKTNADALISLL